MFETDDYFIILLSVNIENLENNENYQRIYSYSITDNINKIQKNIKKVFIIIDNNIAKIYKLNYKSDEDECKVFICQNNVYYSDKNIKTVEEFKLKYMNKFFINTNANKNKNTIKISLNIDLSKFSNYKSLDNIHKLFWGYVQSGKTGFTLDLAIYILSKFKINVIICVLPSCRDQIKKISETKYGSENFNYIFNNKDLKNLFKEQETPKITIIGLHHSNIEKLHKELLKYNIIYSLLIDEGDEYNDCYDCDSNKVTENISKLIESSKHYSYITATVGSLMYLKNKPALKYGDVNYIDYSDDYIGVKTNLYGNKKIDILRLNDDDDLFFHTPKKFNEKLFNEKFTEIYEISKLNLNKKIVMLVTITSSIDGHDLIMNNIRKICKNSSFIIVNKRSYRSYLNDDDDYKQLKNITDALRYCKNSKKDNDIFIIGGNSFSRSIITKTIMENSNYNIEDPEYIYPNCQLLCCSKDLGTDNIHQLIRLSGNYPGHKLDKNFKLLLFTTNNIYESIIQQHHHDELIKERIKDDYYKDKTIYDNLPTTDELLNRKTVSKSRGPQVQKKIGDKVYHNQYQIDNVKQSSKQNSSIYIDINNENTVIGLIIKILKKNNKMTAREIYEKEKELWDIMLSSETPVDTIRARCLELFDNNILNRMGNPFKYYIL